MLASLSHRWVLLMNPKTGTTSLNKTFGKNAEIRVGGNPQLKHLTYKEYRRMFGNFFVNQGCEAFVVVRHPIEVLKSWYRFRARPELADPSHKRHRNYTGNISFPDFIEEWAEGAPRAKVSAGVDFCLDREGRLAKDLTYYRFEDLDMLFRTIAEKSDMTVDIPVLNKSPDAPELGGLDKYDATRLFDMPKVAEAIALYKSIDFVEAEGGGA